MHWVVETISKYWLNWFCSIITALLALVYRRVLLIKKASEAKKLEDEKQNKALCDAMVALMRDRIFQSCRYHLKNGFITTNDLDVLNALYDSYHTLGGDTVATKLVERVHDLKIMIEDIH